MGPFPVGWQAECFPGALFSHVPKILKNMLEKEQVRIPHLVIQMGINHRNQTMEAISTTLEEMMEIITPMVDHVHFLALSSTTNAPAGRKKFCRELNTLLSSLVPPSQFIHPIPSELVSMVTPELDEVHYSRRAAKAIGTSIISHFSLN
jgi:hypothetical protein